jgi:uncharacterized coiled-coil protein SlyX
MSMQTEVQVNALRKAVADIEKRLGQLEEVASSQLDVIPLLRNDMTSFFNEIKALKARMGLLRKQAIAEVMASDDGK